MSFYTTTSYEPFRSFRWTVTFGTAGINKFTAMKVDKPMYKVGEYAHKYLNHQFNFPGRVVWDPVTITFVDMPGEAQDKLMAALRSAGYPALTTGGTVAQNGTDGLSKASATGALGNVTITQLKAKDAPADGATHETSAAWTLKNAYIQDVKFGSLDYGSEDAVQIQVTVRYDWAEATAVSSTPVDDDDDDDDTDDDDTDDDDT